MGDPEAQIAERFRLLGPQLNERQRRAFAASEARTFGRGGIAAAARACGLAENTVRKGLRELSEEPLEAGRVRKAGAGRRAVEESDPELLDALRGLVQSDTRGDPERVLLWTSKSSRNLAAELTEQGHPVGFRTVPKLLRKLGFGLQSARKTLEGKQHPDRDAQFRHINDTVSRAIAGGQPAISIDTKKKELFGEFKNPGREWHPKGAPPRVNTHDFPSMADGKAIPYGVYDIADDSAMVSVGIDRDTAQFSVAAIRAWWEQFGNVRYPQAQRLVITADCGGSNGNRTRLWKTELQKLANQTGLEIIVCHFPPGTSKWNKSAWAAAHQGTMKCCRRSAGRGSRLDSGAQLNPQQVWRRAAGPRIVATSTNPRFGSHQGPSPAGRSSTPSGRRQQCSRSMIESSAWTCIAIALSRASATLVPGAA